MSALEVNFDGLAGPTHNYAGLSFGNVASAANRDAISCPREAALQGLAKMRALMRLGLAQGVLPPQERPHIGVLRRLGFSGTDAAVWESAWRVAPEIARRACASSSMWAANAATVSPSIDCADRRLHITPANLVSMAHRALEAPETTRLLRAVFGDESRFRVDDALPSHPDFADEGAANHMRLCAEIGAPGVEVFVYGRDADTPTRFPARQSRAACEAIARRHDLSPARTVFLRQAPDAIEAGAFHNDVVAVAHENVLFFHERAFAEKGAALDEIARKAEGLFEPVFIEVTEQEVPLADAISSYLFNGQLVRAPGADRMTLILPEEARENPRTRAAVERVVGSNGPIGPLEYFDLRQSMRNGGGPACLRLAVVMTMEERDAAARGFFLTERLADELETWVKRHYRDRLSAGDLADPALVKETRAALDELTRVLPLGAEFYDFQRR